MRKREKKKKKNRAQALYFCLFSLFFPSSRRFRRRHLGPRGPPRRVDLVSDGRSSLCHSSRSGSSSSSRSDETRRGRAPLGARRRRIRPPPSPQSVPDLALHPRPRLPAPRLRVVDPELGGQERRIGGPTQIGNQQLGRRRAVLFEGDRGGCGETQERGDVDRGQGEVFRLEEERGPGEVGLLLLKMFFFKSEGKRKMRGENLLLSSFSGFFPSTFSLSAFSPPSAAPFAPLQSSFSSPLFSLSFSFDKSENISSSYRQLSAVEHQRSAPRPGFESLHRGDPHHDVKDCPYRTKDGVGRSQHGLLEGVVPALGGRGGGFFF